MIPTIIFFLLRRYRRRNPLAAKKLEDLFRKAGKVVTCLFILIAISHRSGAQDQKLEYKVIRKGQEVGTMHITKQSAGNKTIFRLFSEIKTRLVFLITAKGEEEAIYENGILVSSWIFRKMNGSEKANKHLLRIGNNYVIKKGSSVETVHSRPIRYNMLSLYTWEPVFYHKVFSDNFQQELDIQQLAPHHYKIKFPDGNHNEYFYRNGICEKINIHHRFYSATIKLKI
jgi:hypothetical protein